MVMRWRSFLADNDQDRGGGDQRPDVRQVAAETGEDGRF